MSPSSPLSTPPNTRSILVLGAGELGLPILTHLAKLAPSQSYPVHLTVMLRPGTISNASGPKARDIETLKDLGISLLACDTSSAAPEDLTALFRPFHTIIDCAGMYRRKGGQLHVARAVLAAGIRKYIPWQFGVDYDLIGRGSGQDLFDEQLDLRCLLRSQDTTSWIIVSTGMFTSFLFEPSFGIIVSSSSAAAGPMKASQGPPAHEAAEPSSSSSFSPAQPTKPPAATTPTPIPTVTVHALGTWQTSISVTSPSDIGRVTARVAYDDSIANTVLYSAGDTVTYQQLADIVDDQLTTNHVQREVKRELWTLAQLREQLRHDPDNATLKYRLVFAQGRGLSWKIEDTVNHRWGMEMEDVKAYAQKHLNLLLRDGV